MFTKLLFKLLPWLIILILGVALYLTNGGNWLGNQSKHQMISHHIILNKIEPLGKLELVKYNFTDIVTLKENLMGTYSKWTSGWGDSEIIILANGEAVGCIDLTKLDTNSIKNQGDSLIIITLPLPEICYQKINHSKTKVVDQNLISRFSNDANFQNRAFAIAENQIKEAALEGDIFEQTNKMALLILQPLLEQITQKTVILRTQLPNKKNIENGATLPQN